MKEQKSKSAMQSYLMDKFFKDWQKANQPMLEDLEELVLAVEDFKVMWGVPFRLEIDQTEPPRGRELGKEFMNIIDDTFLAQSNK